jgi:hypothetical protein
MLFHKRKAIKVEFIDIIFGTLVRGFISIKIKLGMLYSIFIIYLSYIYSIFMIYLLYVIIKRRLGYSVSLGKSLENINILRLRFHKILNTQSF